MPGVISRADRGGQRQAVRVGSGEAAEIAAFAEARAGHKKAHGVMLRLGPALLAASLLFLRQHQERSQQYERQCSQQRSFLGHPSLLCLCQLMAKQ